MKSTLKFVTKILKHEEAIAEANDEQEKHETKIKDEPDYLDDKKHKKTKETEAEKSTKDHNIKTLNEFEVQDEDTEPKPKESNSKLNGDEHKQKEKKLGKNFFFTKRWQ